VLHKSLALIPLLVSLGAAPALAKTVVIAELGTAPLLGTSTSTAALRTDVAHHRVWMRAAATKLGLSGADYASFAGAIASSHVAWVVVPRHLDAMTWRSGNRVYVLHDVEIPAGTRGWEVDLRAHGRTLALFMPATCGNLSLIVRPLPARIAMVPRPRVAALAPLPAPIVPAAPAAPVVAAAPVPDDSVPPAAPVAHTFPPAVAAHHAFFWYPLLLGLTALNGGGSSGPSAVPALVPAAAPVIAAGCP
jgi:hypothetical protein